MSISLVLVPAALAVVALSRAEAGPDDAGRTVCRVSTRMRDPRLLAAALADTGARVDPEPTAREVLTASWLGVQARFERGAPSAAAPEGVWTAHLTGDVDEQRAASVVAAVDAAYGRRVQQAVLARLHQRAGAAGLSVESQSWQGDDVTLVLTVGAGVAR